MALGVDEATRIVRFCLAGDGWGTASTEDDTRVLKLVVNGDTQAQVFRFEAASFELALKLAVDAGVLRAASVEKQIAFLGRVASPEAGERSDAEASLPAGGPVQFPELTAMVSALVHETQRERGISSLYAASGGRRFGEQLVSQWRATERRRRALAIFQEGCTDRLPSAVAGQLGRAQDLLSKIVASRGRIEKLQVPPTELIDSYSHLNRELLRIIDGLLVTVIDPVQRPTALAWMALLYAKEKTGVERAQLVSAFERDRYFEGQYHSVVGIIAARESYLHLFAAAAPPPAGDLMHENLESPTVSTVQKMEQIALRHRRGGFGVDPTDWFSAITDQMDLYGDVESAVRTSLTPA
jgi:hypothetical protein